MKKSITCIFLLFYAWNAIGQIKEIDTLRLALTKAKKPDTNKLIALKALGIYYMDRRPDSTLIFAQQGYDLALKLNRVNEQADFLKTIADAYGNFGDYVRSLNIYYKLKKVFHDRGDIIAEITVYNDIGVNYIQKKEFQKALPYFFYGLKKYDDYKSAHPLKTYHEKVLGLVIYLNIGETYVHLNMVDSAKHFIRLSYTAMGKNHVNDFALISIFNDLGIIGKLEGKKDTALKYFRKTVDLCIANKYTPNLSANYLDMADLFHAYQQQDSAEYYGEKALQVSIDNKLFQNKLNALQALYTYYEQDHNLPMAYKYLKLSTAANDSLFSQEKLKQLMTVDFDEKLRQANIDSAVKEERNKVRVYVLIFGIVTLILLVFLLWHESRQRAKTNRQLQKQQQELDLINQNLESMIHDRTKDLEDKNERLFKYSYYLSHEIRGPISTIKGLLNIEKEGLVDQHDFVRMITVCVADIDNKITDINDILHEPLK